MKREHYDPKSRSLHWVWCSNLWCTLLVSYPSFDCSNLHGLHFMYHTHLFRYPIKLQIEILATGTHPWDPWMVHLQRVCQHRIITSLVQVLADVDVGQILILGTERSHQTTPTTLGTNTQMTVMWSSWETTSLPLLPISLTVIYMHVCMPWTPGGDTRFEFHDMRFKY